MGEWEMSLINTGKPFTPSSINEFKFRIPIYQRPYAWEENQVLQLLQDLEKSYSPDGNKNYYLGILSVAKTADDSETFDLIDGQQRITTLVLIGKACVKAGLHQKEWKNFVGANRIIFYGRKGDTAFIEKDDTKNCNPIMVNAFNTVFSFLEQMKSEERQKFSAYIYQKAAFFISEMPHNYSLSEKNKQFVRMNNRGKQLEKHEIIKVRLIRQLEDLEEQKRQFENWNKMVSTLTCGANSADHEKSRSQELSYKLSDIFTPDANEENIPEAKEPLVKSIISIEEFILIALARYFYGLNNPNYSEPEKKIEISFSTDKILETFSILSDCEKISGFLSLLTSQLGLLENYIIFQTKDLEHRLVASNDAKESFFWENCSKKELVAAQAYLNASTEPHHWLIPAFNYLQKQEQKNVSAQDFLKQLEKFDNDLLQVGIGGMKRTLKDLESFKSVAEKTVND
ncbi:MAG: DUF262 domain-containing protein, partial [Candidatus Moranbacteria bacterium]|nr:DUF262 domain-containing protein [Candidatus Moranbacteria bacterium]